MKKILLNFLLLCPILCLANNMPLSNNTDFFRTKQNGAWNDVNTWQSSTDNATWTNATLIPDVNSDGVSIFDSVHSIQGVNIDQLTIETGGILTNNATALLPGRITIFNGVGDDFVIKNGGKYLIVSNVIYASHTTLNTGSRTLVQSGGKIVVGNGIDAVGGNNHSIATTSAISALVYWEDDAVFEWNTPTVMTFTNVTFFANSFFNFTTPVLKIVYPVSNLGLTNITNTTINGRLETVVPVTITSTGIKTIRGGIINNALLTINGKLIINNDLIFYNCKLGGTGEIIANGEIDITGINQFTLDVTNSKLITGNINLQNRALINLNNNTLTVNGIITGGSGDPDLRFFNTNGTGALKIMNIGTTPTTFPVGNVTIAAEIYNPVTITNTGIVDNFTVNVTQNYPACLTLAQQQNSVEATWNISEEVAGGSNAQLTLVYGVDGGVQSNVGPSYASVGAKIVHCGATTADYANGSVNGTTVTGTGAGFTIFSPFGITSDMALLSFLPTQIKIFNASPLPYNQSLIKFIITNQDNINSYIIERSKNGIDFEDIERIEVKQNENYSFIDRISNANLQYYRLKINTKNSGTQYSTVQKVIFAKNDCYISSIYPTPAVNTIQLTVYSYSVKKSILQIVNAQGKVIMQREINLQKGINNTAIDISNITKGIYFLKIQTPISIISEKIIKL